jgi:ribosomal protein S18 acetylase RimI-like enzyme
VAAGKIVSVDPSDPEQVLAAAELHKKLLGDSPIPRLGSLFMTRFFYSQLIKDRLIHCYLYRLDNTYVGFLSLTEKPFSFMSEGQRRHFFRLSFILCLALLARPSRIRTLWETLMVTRRKKLTKDCEGTGELLSFGVLEEFSAKRDGENRLRIPNILFDEGIRYFRERGFLRIEWTVNKENLPAMIFYRSYGATLEKSADAWPGDYRVRLEL